MVNCKVYWYLMICYTSLNYSVTQLFKMYFQDKRYPGQPKPRLFTVGRLDVATTGLIIVTNDGMYTASMMHLSFYIDFQV